MKLMIMCDKCGHLVERTVAIHNEFDLTNSIRAYCHGEVDEMVITDSDLVRMGQAKIDQMINQVGRAFASCDTTSGKSLSYQPGEHNEQANRIPHHDLRSPGRDLAAVY